MKNIRKILIIGSDGEIGSYIFDKFKESSFEIYGTSKRNKNRSIIKFDLLEKELPLDLSKYDVCIICAGINNIEICEKNSDFARDVNVFSTIRLIEECKKNNIFLIYFSSVSIFDGKLSFYKTYDNPSPFTKYGHYKLEVEKFLQKEYSNMSAILRLTKVISENTPIIKKWQTNYRLKRKIIVYQDKYISPISLREIFISLNIIIKRKSCGIYHLGGSNELSYYEFALKYFKEKNFSTNLLKPVIFNSSERVYKGKFASLKSSFS